MFPQKLVAGYLLAQGWSFESKPETRGGLGLVGFRAEPSGVNVNPKP